jgi:crotonobetainyl-CoA:carnitine CoA-transferase CaiB-like acyl-CoA transferase
MAPERPPFADLRVIAIEQYGAGPWATMQLADLGADVIKIEDPRSGGDVGRYVPPYQEGTDSLFFESFNRGKRSVLLDLRDPVGREAFERLLLDELLRERTTQEWITRLTATGIPCAPINDIASALGDPQSTAREAVGRYEHPRLGTVRQVRTPFRMAGVDRDLCPAPALGADTTAVLRELCGWDEGRIARLSAADRG